MLGALCQPPDALGEGERLHEIAEAVGALEPVAVFVVDQSPPGESAEEAARLLLG